MAYTRRTDRNPIASYGTRAAQTMIGMVRALPPGQRADVMRKAMDKIDPMLRRRAEGYASVDTTRGVHPALALERGIAKAMHEGLITELAEVGRKGYVGSQPQLGLALGAVSRSPGGGALAVTPTQAPPPAAKVCGNPPPGYSWNPVPPGGWIPAVPGRQVLKGPVPGCIDPATGKPTRDISTGPTGTGGKAGQQVKVGPFVFPAAIKTTQFIRIPTPAALPAEVKAYLLPFMKAGPKTPKYDVIGTHRNDLATDKATGRNDPALAQQLLDFLQAIGLRPGDLANPYLATPSTQPHFKFEHPVHGGEWWIALNWYERPLPGATPVANPTFDNVPFVNHYGWQPNVEGAHDGTGNVNPASPRVWRWDPMTSDGYPTGPNGTHFPEPPKDQGYIPATLPPGSKQVVLLVTIAPKPDRPILKEFADWVKTLVATVVETVGDVVNGIVDAVGDIVCGIVTNPNAAAGAAAANPAAGAGVIVAQQSGLCGKPPQQVVQGSSSLMTWLAIGVGGVVVLALAARSGRGGKKKPGLQPHQGAPHG